MTIYATPIKLDDVLVTVIAAGDTTKEFQKWWDTEEVDPDVARESDLMEHVMYDELNGFKRPVFLFSHSNDAEQKEFLDRGEIQEVGPYIAIERHKDMILDDTFEAELAAEKADTRTLAEVTGTDKEDKWDKGVSKHDMSVMKGAPTGITGDTSLGEGDLKKTIESEADDKEKKILESEGGEFNSIIYKVANKEVPSSLVTEMADKLEEQGELDETVAKLIRTKVSITGGDISAVASPADIKELEEAFAKLNEIALAEDDQEIGIMDQYTDANGDIQINARVYSDKDKTEIRKMRKEAKQESSKEKKKIRKAATAAGLDADQADTYTGVQDDGTVLQRDEKLNTVTEISTDGTTIVRDGDTGKELDEKGIRKKELEAELRELAGNDEADHGTHIEEAEPAKEQTEAEKIENPEEYVFAAMVAPEEDDDHAQGDSFVIFRKDYWEANKCWDDEGAVPQWLESMGFVQLTESVYEHQNADVDSARQTLLYKGVEEVPAILMDEDAIKDYGWVPNGIGSRAKIVKADENNVKPEDYYFAIVPPGFNGSDETAQIIGHETYVVTMPKAKFDAGVKPQDEGGWFTDEELDKFDWDCTSNSMYVMDGTVGDAHRALSDTGAKEDGRLLYAMGLKADTVPMDWPYHYKTTGHRKTNHDLFQDAIRIVEAAREQGFVLKDKDGEIDIPTAGLNVEDIAMTQKDSTAALKRAFGAEGTTDDKVTAIFDAAVDAAKETVEQSSIELGDLKVSAEIKALLGE